MKFKDLLEKVRSKQEINIYVGSLFICTMTATLAGTYLSPKLICAEILALEPNPSTLNVFDVYLDVFDVYLDVSGDDK